MKQKEASLCLLALMKLGGWELGLRHAFHSFHLRILGLPRQLNLARKTLSLVSNLMLGWKARWERLGVPQSQSVFPPVLNYVCSGSHLSFLVASVQRFLLSLYPLLLCFRSGLTQ